jgi:hypothetical protein
MTDLTEAITTNVENKAAPLVTTMSSEKLNPKGRTGSRWIQHYRRYYSRERKRRRVL